MALRVSELRDGKLVDTRETQFIEVEDWERSLNLMGEVTAEPTLETRWVWVYRVALHVEKKEKLFALWKGSAPRLDIYA